jgi:hypothetical protein
MQAEDFECRTWRAAADIADCHAEPVLVTTDLHLRNWSHGEVSLKWKNHTLFYWYPNGWSQLFGDAERSTLAMERINKCLPKGYVLFRYYDDWGIKTLSTGKCVMFFQGIYLRPLDSSGVSYACKGF